MSESPSPPSPSPQTSNIFVDRPCLKCGYNLRGQTATWHRRALNWQVTCPECGGVQVVALGSNERRAGDNPVIALGLAVVGAWIVWQLLSWLATSMAAMMGPPNPQLIAALGLSKGALAVGSPLDYDKLTLLEWFLVLGVPIALASFLLGAILSLAPHARAQDRNFVLLLFLFGAIIFAMYLDLTVVDNSWSRSNTSPSWKLLASSVAFLVALIGARAGLAAGRPFAKMVAGMYVRPEA